MIEIGYDFDLKDINKVENPLWIFIKINQMIIQNIKYF